MDDEAAVAPAAAAPAAAQATAEQEGTILHENPGYPLIYYGPETTSDDRFPLNLASCGSVLRELIQQYGSRHGAWATFHSSILTR